MFWYIVVVGLARCLGVIVLELLSTSLPPRGPLERGLLPIGARFDKAETKRVVKMINAELGEAALAPEVFDQVFDMWWPKLETEVNEILAKPVEQAETQGSERDILEEVLSLTRHLSRNPQYRVEADHRAFDDLAARGESHFSDVAGGEHETRKSSAAQG